MLDQFIVIIVYKSGHSIMLPSHITYCASVFCDIKGNQLYVFGYVAVGQCKTIKLAKK